MWETWVRSLGWKDPLEKGTAIHSSILAWGIPWTVYPWGCRVWHDRTTSTLSHLRRSVRDFSSYFDLQKRSLSLRLKSVYYCHESRNWSPCHRKNFSRVSWKKSMEPRTESWLILTFKSQVTTTKRIRTSNFWAVVMCSWSPCCSLSNVHKNLMRKWLFSYLTGEKTAEHWGYVTKGHTQSYIVVGTGIKSTQFENTAF